MVSRGEMHEPHVGREGRGRPGTVAKGAGLPSQRIQKIPDHGANGAGPINKDSVTSHCAAPAWSMRTRACGEKCRCRACASLFGSTPGEVGEELPWINNIVSWVRLGETCGTRDGQRDEPSGRGLSGEGDTTRRRGELSRPWIGLDAERSSRGGLGECRTPGTCMPPPYLVGARVWGGAPARDKADG